MRYAEAQEELRRVLAEQQTISIPKLKRLIQALNISLKKPEPKNAVRVVRRKNGVATVIIFEGRDYALLPERVRKKR